MQCKACRCEMAIGRTYKQAQGDDSPEKVTRLWLVQVMRCRNRACSQFGVEQAENRVLLYEGSTENQT